MAGSLAGHGLVLAVLVGLQPQPPLNPEMRAITVQLYTPPPPEPPPPPPDPKPEPKAKSPEPPAPKRPTPPKPTQRKLARPAKAPPTVAPILAVAGPVQTGESDVSDAELAGAATAGSGSGGGGGRACNMTRWLEGQLRKDRTVQAAFAESDAGGKAVRVWNGRWVRHGGQEGNGLAQVREAIMWHVAFAPEACRTEPVHGLVAISLRDGPGSARIVMGSSAWRWSDLLHARSGG